MRIRAALIFLIALGASEAAAQSIGSPPTPSLAFRDIQAEFALPQLKDAKNGVIDHDAKGLQVIVRAGRLGVSARSATQAWALAGGQFQAAQITVAAARSTAGETPFNGNTISQLNDALRRASTPNFKVTSQDISVDEPLILNRTGARVDLGNARLRQTTATVAYAIRIEDARGIDLVGGVFTGGGSSVLISKSRNVTIVDGQFTGLQGNGIVVTNSQDIVIWGNKMTDLGRAPVMLHGATSGSVVADNQITENRGASNWHAGVVVTDRNVDLTKDPLNLFDAGHYWVAPTPIVKRSIIPQHNLIAFNLISQNRASGLYFDGAVENVVVSNIVQANAKEGLCLDNGSTANVVALNTVQQNGQRWGNSDEDLQRDFVLGPGRLADGTAAAKVPGISVDNAAYNIIYANNVDENFGGGIKIVRTGYFNIVGLNTILDNNIGESKNFHFFGIELGSASADAPAADLDFTPARGNLIFGNIIRGSHYAGIFLAAGSDENDLFDNSIFGATSWAMESVSHQNNATLNNLTNQPSRNIDPGMDRRLAGLSAGRFDDAPH